MPRYEKVPLAGQFSLSVLLPSGDLVGSTTYNISVTSCPPEWYYHSDTTSCLACDTTKSECRGGKELPVPRSGFWSDLENAHLGYVCVESFKL
jgi:hypothetical protein